MEVSPFPYQGPLQPDEHTLRGRDDLVADLLERVTEHRVTALLGPRRYGKTSVLAVVADRLAAAGVNVVWIDLFGVQSEVDLIARIDQSLAATQGSLRRRLDQLAATAEINLGLVRLSFTGRGATPDRGAVLDTLIDIFVRSALENPTVLICDEFSAINEVPGAAAKLRTHLQHHYERIGLLFAGSRPSTMRMLFEDREQPFYAQADRVEIGPLSAAATLEIINDGFDRTGRDPGPLASLVQAFCGGHPQRSMQLADAAWRLAAPGAAWTESVWSETLAVVRRHEASEAERVWERHDTAERAVLRLVAARRPLFGRDADLVGLASSSASNTRRKLLADGRLSEHEGRLTVTDPLFADWIVRNFPT